MIIGFTGPSGSGKTTILRMLQEKYGYKEIISYCTREKREGEVEGIDYKFVSKEEFDKLDLVESVQFGNTYYGLGKADFEFEGLRLVIVEPNGLEQVRKHYKGKVVGIYFDSDYLTRQWRLLQQVGFQDDEVLKREYKKVTERLKRDKGKFNHIAVNHVVNADLDIEELYSIVDGIIRREMLSELDKNLNGGNE